MKIRSRGFTIIELIVVIAVIAVLAVIVVVGYGAWQGRISETRVKHTLSNAATAMENARTFSNSYPLTLPTDFETSPDVVLTLASGSSKTYCIDGHLSTTPADTYYVDDIIAEAGPKSGTCATRTNLPIPDAPADFAIVSAYMSKIQLGWTMAANASGYVAQCAADPAFVLDKKEKTVTTVGAEIDGLTFGNVYHCRVKAVNSSGSSAWTSSVSTQTSDQLGGLPVAASIEGYWTTPPEGFLFEDGSAVSRSTYAALFSVIGTSYGAGNGTTTFNLPDSRGRAIVNQNSADAEFDTVGETYGTKNETLSIAQMPSHTHIQNAHTHAQDAHAHAISDPGHNHTQNPHTHSNGSGISPNGDAIGLCCGGQGGWSLYAGTNNAIFRLYFNDVVASNYSSGTGISYNSATATNQSTVATNQNEGGGGSHNNIQLSIVKVSAIKYTTADSSAPTVPAGTSIQGYWNTVPTDYVEEDGATLSRTAESALFAAVGTTYGAGDGSTTFNVPDSRGRVGVNQNPSDAEFDAMGERPGAKTETLTIAQMPSHTHIQNAHNHIQNTHNHVVSDPGHNHTQAAHSHSARNTPDGNVLGMTGGTGGGWGLKIGTNNNNIYRMAPTSTTATNNAALTGVGVYSTVATNQSSTATNQNTGGDSPHNNIQPVIVKKSAMKKTVGVNVSSSMPVGSSMGGYWSTVPSGYLLEDGSAVSRTLYANLFAVIGTTFGSGDGSTTFNLPDSRGRTTVNKSATDTEFDTLGEKTGSKTETLTIAQIPSHTHIQNAHTHIQNPHTHSVYDPGHTHSQNAHNHEIRNTQNGDFAGMAGSNQGGWGIANEGNNSIFQYVLNPNTATNNPAYTGVTLVAAVATNQPTTATNQSTGGGGSHNNIMPSIVKKYVIKY